MWRATSVIVCALSFAHCATSTGQRQRPINQIWVRGQASPRVRAPSLAIGELIALATERSPTFKRLVETIDQTDGIVYVLEGRCRYGARACMPMTITPAGEYRIVRITIDPRKKTPKELMVSIGHELHHAIEVLSNTSLTNSQLVYGFYNRDAPLGQLAFETPEAIRTGDRVGADLRAWDKASRR